MLKYLALSIATAIISLAVIEGQYVALAMSTLARWDSEPTGPSPTEVIASGIGEDGTALLAVGDIAKCDERPGLGKTFENTFYLLGLPSATDPSTSPAADTAAMAESAPGLPILALGDIAYSRSSPAEFHNCFDPVWGQLQPRILPTPGNHEYKTPAAFGYFDYWHSQAGPDRRGYYAVRVPGWLILSLNSQIDAEPGSPQAVWLEDQLADAPETCILAFYHKPAYSVVARKGRRNAVDLFRILQAGGATLVLNGHNHFYERTRPLGPNGEIAPETGTVGFTVGTGGRVANPAPLLSTTAASVVMRTGMLHLDLRDGAYEWNFLDAQTGKVLDTGSRDCNIARRRGASDMETADEPVPATGPLHHGF